MRALLLSLSAVSAATPSLAQTHPLETVTDGYLATYFAEDVEAMAQWLADDVVFEDPSMELVGKDAFLAGIAEAFTTFTIHGFDETRRIYSSRSHVLVVGQVRFTVHSPTGDSPALDLPFAVSLKVRDGQIVRQVDFVDAFEFARQMRG